MYLVKLFLLLLELASTLGHSSYHQYNLTFGWLLTDSLHATLITRPHAQHEVERNSSTRPARSRTTVNPGDTGTVSKATLGTFMHD